MRATDGLRHDHDVLRITLTRLDERLACPPAAPSALQPLTHSIARLLRDHTEREERLFGKLREALRRQSDERGLQLLADHEHHRKTAAALLELLGRCTAVPVDHLCACAANAIASLREQLAEEEARVFPAIDQFLREASEPSPADQLEPVITGEMVVQDVERIHPRAREVFRAFGVDPDADGPCRLDGLTWRRRVDVEALTLALRQSLGADGHTAPIPQLLWDSCDGLMVIDERRRILAMNHALERLMGRRVQDVAGSECSALLACQDARGCPLANHPERCPGLKAVRRRRPVAAAEYTIAADQGRRLPVSTSYTPLRCSSAGTTWALVAVRTNAVQKRRERHLAEQAMRDPLTTLPNRAGFMEACASEFARASRHPRPLAVAMADLDGLKTYNDTYGHLAGDELLKTVGGALRIGRRSGEVVGRYGGDEFAVLLPETAAPGAMVAAERLRQTVTEFSMAHASAAGGAPPSLTLSVGIAVFPDDGPTLSALLRTADQRLYEAKHRGRNQVVGPANCLERRRQRRIRLEAAIRLTISGIEQPPFTHEGRLTDLSLTGAYCTTAPWKPLIHLGELVAFSLTIPPAHSAEFPYAQLAGHGRIVRMHGLPDTAAGEKRIGLALDFDELPAPH